MAYIDAQLLLSDGQEITTSAASTNVIDLGSARKIFEGTAMAIVVSIDVAAVGTGTYTVVVQTDDNAGFSSATTVTSQVLVPASLTAGSVHTIGVPPGATLEKYLRLSYTTGGTSPAATLTAYLQPANMVPQVPTHYADNISIA